MFCLLAERRIPFIQDDDLNEAGIEEFMRRKAEEDAAR
jgi:hypothetical protein